MFGISLISIVLKQYDKILISKFLSITTFGTYAVTNNFVNKANLISLSISQAVYPRFCILFEKGKIREIKILFSQIYEIVGVMTLPIYICFFWFSSYLFEFILNEQISEQLKLPTLFLCIAFYLNGLLSCIYRVCLAFDKTKYALFQDIVCFVILLPMSYFLIKNYGIIGGSISVLFYFIIGNLYFLPISVFPAVFSKLFNNSP